MLRNKNLPSKFLTLMLAALMLLASNFALAAEKFTFSHIYAKGGFSEQIQELKGKQVKILGYMAPPLVLDADFFVLTRIPMSVCPFCDNEADWPRNIIFIQMNKKFKPVPFNRIIEVSGILELGSATHKESGFVSMVRIVDARIKQF